MNKLKVALPLGVEPRSSVPETNVLSIELQEHDLLIKLFSINWVKFISIPNFQSFLTSMHLNENESQYQLRFGLNK